MTRNRVKTKDLYFAAYIISCGGIVEDIYLSENRRLDGRPFSATFVLSGENVAKLSEAFLQGQACANVIAFRQAMHRLRDKLLNLTKQVQSVS